MITFEEAKQIALDKVGPDCALVDDATLAKPYGWYFCYQSKAYLQSGDLNDMLLGSGGFIVEQEDGYVFEFGSAYPLEHHLAAYEAGFRFDSYDLTILSIGDLRQTIELLLKLDMTYAAPEGKYAVVWQIPKTYTDDQLRSALMSLPHTFFNQGLNFRFEEFLALERAVVSINCMDIVPIKRQSLYSGQRANGVCCVRCRSDLQLSSSRR
jgi:hypothetical protein